MKKCCQCKIDLPLDSFQKNRTAPDGLQYRCRACTKKASKTCREKRGHLWLQKTNPWDKRPENAGRKNARTRARQAKRKAETPDKVREERRRWELKAKYGLSPELKQALVEAQGNVCAICYSPIDAVSCATDHNHAQNYVRGMLCKPCNSALGLFKDSPEVLRRAAEYLEASKKIEQEPTTETFIEALDILEKVNVRRQESVTLSKPSSA